MKTFEEALGVVMKDISRGDAVINAEFGGVLARYAGLGAQVQANTDVGTMILGTIHAVADDKLDIPTALFTLFMNGLIVGMEMEKAE